MRRARSGGHAHFLRKVGRIGTRIQLRAAKRVIAPSPEPLLHTRNFIWNTILIRPPRFPGCHRCAGPAIFTVRPTVSMIRQGSRVSYYGIFVLDTGTEDVHREIPWQCLRTMDSMNGKCRWKFINPFRSISDSQSPLDSIHRHYKVEYLIFDVE